jgi:integrase
MTASHRKAGLLASPVASLLADFCASQILRSSPGEITRSERVIRRFLWRAGITSWSDITASAVERYLASAMASGLSAKTIRNRRAAMSRFCNWSVRRGFLRHNPVADVDAPPLPVSPPSFLTEAELAEALAVADRSGCWPEVALAVATGLRLGELMRLAWADVDIDRSTLLVRKAKGGRFRTVPLNALASEALRRQRAITGQYTHVFPPRRSGRPRGDGDRFEDRQRTDPHGMIRSIEPVRLAIAKFNALSGKSTGRAFHLLRHTFCTLLAQHGVSPKKIQEWAGHKDFRTTERYIHLVGGYDPDIERFPVA